MIDFKDVVGLAVIQALVKIGTAGNGYIEYLWTKPDALGTFEDLGYVAPIPSTDSIIGSGRYSVDIKESSVEYTTP